MCLFGYLVGSDDFNDEVCENWIVWYFVLCILLIFMFVYVVVYVDCINVSFVKL